MPLPRGSDPEKAVIGYLNALHGFSIGAVTSGIRKFLRGECDGVSPKFCPHPPELAAIVRGFVPNAPASSGQCFGFKPPASKVLEKACTKDYAAQLVRNGVYPRGSIWIPGPYGENAHVGRLFAPDENWQNATPIHASAE